MANQVHPIEERIPVILGFVVIAYAVWRSIRSFLRRPRFRSDEIVFQEWFASGASLKNFVTELGGASGCLRLVITKDFLWVTTWFPFSLIAWFYDLEHLVPLPSITSVKGDRFFGRPFYVVTFTMENGKARSLRLGPKQPDAFCQSLGACAESIGFSPSK